MNREEIGILLIDVQPAFLDYAYSNHNDEREALLVRLEHLLMLSDWMDLPLIATFEIPLSENGELPVRLDAVFPDQGQRFEKNYFCCTLEGNILAAIEQFPGKQIVVAGAETDVCILQSVLGLLQLGYQVYLLEDCLFTSEPHPGSALRRLYQAGAIPCTLKSMAYELVRSVDEIPWYPELWNLKDRSDTKPFPDNFLPPEGWPAWEPKL
jgi:nicotinamidase-related amidase